MDENLSLATEELKFDLRITYAQIVSIFLHKIAQARMDMNYVSWFENMKNLYIEINQKKILAIWENYPSLKGSLTALHSDHNMNFLSLPALQTNLGILVKYGILQSFTEMNSQNRGVMVYSIAKDYTNKQNLNIPHFKEVSL